MKKYRSVLKEKIAEENKVSIAWVVRDAVENYLTAADNNSSGIKGIK